MIAAAPDERVFVERVMGIVRTQIRAGAILAGPHEVILVVETEDKLRVRVLETNEALRLTRRQTEIATERGDTIADLDAVATALDTARRQGATPVMVFRLGGDLFIEALAKVS